MLFASDALLLGRVTDEGFAAAWPTMPETGDFGDRLNGLPKYGASKTLAELVRLNSRLIGGDVAAAVAALKEDLGEDILVGGSADLVNFLMRHDLVDEYRLMVHPVVVGHGKRLFGDGNETTPRGPEVVVLTYRPAGRWTRATPRGAATSRPRGDPVGT